MTATTTLPAQAVDYIVVLNWNGWRDTIECLESLLHLQHHRPVVIVVCDNASQDGSPEHIVAWAHGKLASTATAFLQPRPPRPKPLPLLRLTRAEAEAGAPARRHPLVLVDNGANLGFAGGCNVGLRHALRDPACAGVWLLNSDSVAAPQALSALVDACRRRPQVGLCGSQVRYYDRPDLVQTYGGLLDRWTSRTHSLFNGVPAQPLAHEPQRIDYVPGASMYATRAFLEQVGLMSEHYFLYFEEIDWAERAKGRFQLALARDSVVYHRGAASIGEPGEAGERGVRSEYYLLRNRLVFARRFYPARLPTVYLGLLASLARRASRGQWSRARVALRALAGWPPPMLLAPARHAAKAGAPP